MIGIYFSGTGNSRYALETFLQMYDVEAKALSIEEEGMTEKIKEHEEIVFSYPVQYSTVPKILRDFVIKNSTLWGGKKVFIIATMGMFSGDGAGVLGRLLQKYGAEVIGGLHLKMPDSICDEKVLKRPLEKNIESVKNAENKIEKAVKSMKNGSPPREGIGWIYRMAGFFGQRFYFGHKTKNYTDKLKINTQKCISCGKCTKICPMNNIACVDGKMVSGDKCTMCYRCVNRCPAQAITLLGKEVVEQTLIEKYLNEDACR